MNKGYTIKAEVRKKVGKGSSRKLRRNDQIPAIIYGENQDPFAISLSYKDISFKINNSGFLTTVAEIEVSGKNIEVLPKDYQVHPVNDTPLHVDFLRVSKKSVVQINIPVHFINSEVCIGIKHGGILNIIHHEIEVFSSIKSIVEFFEVDISNYRIGDSIHISYIKFPPGMKPVIQDHNFVIATIVAPISSSEEEENTEKKQLL